MGNKIIINKDKYGIFHGFIDKERANFSTYRLYQDKYIMSLSEFLYEMIDDTTWKKLKNKRIKGLEITLDYLLPLLKEGKLKVRITLEQTYTRTPEGKWYYKPTLRKEYYKKEAEEAINEIKKIWISLKDEEEKSFFATWRVEFILYENKWPD